MNPAQDLVAQADADCDGEVGLGRLKFYQAPGRATRAPKVLGFWGLGFSSLGFRVFRGLGFKGFRVLGAALSFLMVPQKNLQTG